MKSSAAKASSSAKSSPQLERVIPFMDLARLFDDHREEFLKAMTGVLDRAAYIGGEELAKFEREFARWVGGDAHAVGCANGTDAITLAARALDLPPGSEAIVPAMTYVATAAALVNAGIKVRLVDVTEGTCVLDPDKVEAAITPRTKLLVPVHLYGQMADMERLRAIADRHGLKILEDAAQAHGSKWKHHPVGHYGDVASYSFYPGKNLGAFGDAGGVLSRNPKIVEQVRRLCNHGGLKKYEHEVVGCNSRLDNLQAAILNVKLKYIDQWTEARRRVAGWYRKGLSEVEGLILPTEAPAARHTYHLFVVRVADRERVQAHLKERHIETGVHYPKAIHEHASLAAEFKGQKFPVAEKLACHGVALTMCPTLGEKDVDRVVNAVREFFQ